MSVESMALVLHHSRSEGKANVVMIGIANHDGDGGAWPSIATLGRYAKVQPRGVKKILRRLEALGELRTDVQAGGTREMEDYERPNRYTILVACPAGCAGGTQHRPKPGWTRWADGTYARCDDDTNPAADPVDNHPDEGVSPRTPGVPTDTRGGVPTDTQTVPVTTQANSGSSLSTDRARDQRGICSVCSQDYDTHEARQARLAADDRHPYTPRAPRTPRTGDVA